MVEEAKRVLTKLFDYAEEQGIKSCSVGNTWYWEREKKDGGKNG